MSVPAGSHRTVWYGVSPHGEIFETGAWLSNNSVASQADAQDMADTVAGVISGLANTTLRSLIPSTATYNGVRTYSYVTGGPTATYVADSPFTTPVAGNGTNDMPLQVAMCITTLTGAAGRRARGRIYLPAYAASSSGNAFVNTVVDNTVDGIAAMMTSWETNHAAQWGHWVVVSVQGSAARAITQLRSDNKPDIQRRRANSFIATHLHTATV